MKNSISSAQIALRYVLGVANHIVLSAKLVVFQDVVH
jgi:hypothetical protein